MNAAHFCYLGLWKRPGRMAQIAALAPEPEQSELRRHIEEARALDRKELLERLASALDEQAMAAPAGVPLDNLPPAVRKWFQPWTTK